MAPRIDLSGKKFGRLTVIAAVGKDTWGTTLWKCQCDCGNDQHITARPKRYTSCGCRTSEATIERNKRSGTENINFKHGQTKTAEYRIWMHMRLRCSDPNEQGYERYGGRGITVCEEWKDDFVTFLRDMGKRPSSSHSLDRKDNNGTYALWNCRWATKKEQQRNMRSNRLITVNGETRCLIEWCELLGIPKWRPFNRVNPNGKFRTIDSVIEFLVNKMSN